MSSTMAEGPQSIKSRIAALNLEEVHVPAPGTKPTYTYETLPATKKKPPPPPPTSRPPAYQRQQTVNNPPILSNAPTTARHVGNQPIVVKPDTPHSSPALPPRPAPRSSTTPRQMPALPPRNPSERSVNRRESTESISTIASGISTLSLGSVKTNGTAHSNGSVHQVRAPAYDPSKLPPLPPKKAPEDPKQSKATLNAMRSKRNYVPSQALPPQLKTPDLPARPSLPPRQSVNQERSPERPALPGRPTTGSSSMPKTSKVIAPPPRRSALEMGFNNETPSPPAVPSSRPSQATSRSSPASSAPPPIPLASRPNLNAIMASKPKPGVSTSCLKCRDFSGPDNHAARFPRTQLPSSDVGWLAQQLCSQFSSPTDKARSIFTWLHHNVDYDVFSFFNNTVQPSTPEKTITSGLAVCEGYAGLFAALALKAGLQAMVISGASKGFGHEPLQPGQPIPPFKMTHAWNAVKVDNGEWKLIDACWGAGHIGCQMKNEGYIRSFNPSMFTMDNDEFGLKHYPSEASHQFRNDGRIMPYEEFMTDDIGGRVHTYELKDHGIGERTVYPPDAKIKINDPQASSVVHFQFSSICPHWDNARHGKGPPYVMLLSVAGLDGRKPTYLPFSTDGRTWWLDVNRRELGAPGQKITVNAVTDFNNKDARGLSYEAWNNKTSYSCKFGWVASWELV
ncbi:hypothetical protein J1614_008697 [Plenodomus biglobosus]|nr:hypothetical protein J1614_008697 [Plenodomus biglobosus]